MVASNRVPGAVWACILWALISAAESSKPDDDPWPPLTEAERAWSQPGHHAVLLYRDEESDAPNALSKHFYRIKILTREGLRYGNVEIPHIKGSAEVKKIEARVLQPGGAVVPFTGEVFEKTVARRRKIRVLTKTFTLPDLQVGSILEYRVRMEWKRDIPPPMRWNLDHELFTMKARFVFHPYEDVTGFRLDWRGYGLGGKRPIDYGLLPQQLQRKLQKPRVRELNMENIPFFSPEALMPPESVARPNLEFYYSPIVRTDHEPVKGEAEEMLNNRWTDQAIRVAAHALRWLDGDRSLRRVASELAGASATAELKVRNLYERAQGIRNLTYDTSSFAAAGKLEENRNAEDVLRRGYGSSKEINRLFVALARAAGFEAWIVVVPERDRLFFDEKVHEMDAFTGEVAIVRIDGKDRIFDPGTPLCPYGLVSWEKSAVQGIRLVKGGGLWVKVPPLSSDATEARRTLKLRLDDRGGIEGELNVAFTGQEALERRIDARDEDDLERRKSLEEEVKRWLPDGSAVKVVKAGPWDRSDGPLEVEFRIRIAGIVARTATRMMLPLSVLRAGRAAAFHQSFRIHPIYIPYPYQESDEIRMALPAAYAVEHLPSPRKVETPFARYETSWENVGGEIVFRRKEAVEGILVLREQYPTLRAFFESMRVADEDRVVLRVSAAGR